jgi:hypothetical protein
VVDPDPHPDDRDPRPLRHSPGDERAENARWGKNRDGYSQGAVRERGDHERGVAGDERGAEEIGLFVFLFYFIGGFPASANFLSRSAFFFVIIAG